VHWRTSLKINMFQKTIFPSQWQWTKTTRAKRLFSLCRWLHVYLSAALLSLLLFFCLTGFTLNHASWFSEEGDSGITTHPLPHTLRQTLSANDAIPVEQIKVFIQEELGLINPRSIDIELDMGEINLDYPLPAGYAFVTLILDEGIMEVDHRAGNLVALLNNLHKGRHTGAVWSLLIDISAIIMTVFSLAGFVILLQHKKYRSPGLFFVAIGTLSPFVMYFIYVPNF